MTDNIKDLSCNVFKTRQSGLQLDDFSLPDSDSLRLAYVGFATDTTLGQKLLFAREVETCAERVSVVLIVGIFFLRDIHSVYHHSCLCNR